MAYPPFGRTKSQVLAIGVGFWKIEGSGVTPPCRLDEPSDAG